MIPREDQDQPLTCFSYHISDEYGFTHFGNLKLPISVVYAFFSALTWLVGRKDIWLIHSTCAILSSPKVHFWSGWRKKS